jgi:tetratricopeptide (TPR) repeat protein
MRALRLKITRTAQPRPHDWLRLAEVARTAEDANDALAILREAIEHLPEVSMLRTQMAAMLLQEGRHDEAVTAALHPAAWVDTEARLTALSASIYCGRAADVLNALGDDFQIEGQAYNTILDLAVAHRQAGHIERSQELFARVPEVPERYFHLAQARLLAGDFDQAVRLAQLNLNEKPFPDAPDWLLMGDIRHKQGLRTEAQQAYAHAVEAVATRQQRRTAAIKAERESGSQ